MIRYHRLARFEATYRWWRLPLAVVIGSALYLWFSLVLLGAAWFADPEVLTASTDDIDLTNPVTLLVSLANLGLMIPLVYLSLLIVGYRPLGLISSVVGKLRWSWLLTAGWWALITHASFFAIIMAVDGTFANWDQARVDWQKSVILLLIVLSLVPFQAAAEEYVFRGLLAQLLGAWFRNWVLIAVITTALFTAGHIYDVWGLIDVAIFALFASYWVWRTGGLEVAIAAHVVNNVLLFALGAVEVIDINSTEGAAVSALSTLALLSIFTYVIVQRANLKQIEITRNHEAPESVVT